jgi:hypothetical protein
MRQYHFRAAATEEQGVRDHQQSRKGEDVSHSSMRYYINLVSFSQFSS